MVEGTEICACAARYDQASGRVVVDLVNGCSYAFPAWLVPALQGAGPAALTDVLVDGPGFSLAWPELGVELYVPALVAGVFGSRAGMASEVARAAGRRKSPEKAAAARANGAKGGRPKKVEV